MKRYEVLSALDRITEMTDKEVQLNAEWIKSVALAAYSLIKQQSAKAKGRKA
ncbi:hypothetical protein NYE69_27220 [Paenibacillus sp. FSL R5-0527]|uniref:hypothetical protein n=1 Tax=Paenibacillus sp. FSL R5-0527 TaxID=2975321 RepID=UPI0026C5CC6E